MSMILYAVIAFSLVTYLSLAAQVLRARPRAHGRVRRKLIHDLVRNKVITQ